MTCGNPPASEIPWDSKKTEGMVQGSGREATKLRRTASFYMALGMILLRVAGLEGEIKFSLVVHSILLLSKKQNKEKRKCCFETSSTSDEEKSSHFT